MLKFRSRRYAFGVVTIPLIWTLAACAPVPPPAPTVAPSSTATAPARTKTAVPTATVVPMATNTPFVPKATVKIVSEAPGSFDVAFGAELAVAYLSGPLKELGYDVKFASYDDQDNVDVAIPIAKEIIADPEVLCGVGPLSSTVTLNVGDLYHMAGLAFVSPSATSPKVTDRRYPEVDQVTGRNDVMGTAAAMFAANEGFANVYLLMDDGDFSSQVARSFKAQAAQSGVSVIGELHATVERENLVAAAKLVQAASPVLVFYSGFSWQASPAFKALREAGYMGTLLAAEPNPDLALLAGPLALDGGGMYYVSAGTPAAQQGPAQDFLMLFETTFAKPAGMFAAEAYDAAGICLKAIEEASKAKDGALPTRAEVAKAIRLIKDYPGVTGTLGFDSKGDLLSAGYFVRQVMFMEPAKWDANPVVGSFQLPPPK